MDTLDDVRWAAVLDRDDESLGVFVYAVTSTGIFCRPGCAARRPLRKNVEFYATPDAALAAGFRACKRCRPDSAFVRDAMTATIAEVCRRLEQPGHRATVGAMAKELGYNERHLRRRFQEIVGVTPATYARAQQALRVRNGLQSATTVTQAVVDAGYGSPRAFYEHGATTLGMSPDRFREGGLDENIYFTSVQTPRGFVLISCTSRGVCDVRVGSDEETLETEMRTKFHRAIVQRDDEGLVKVANSFARSVEGYSRTEELPLDVQGTVFQIRVWEALRRIPAGQTRSYADVAADIGAPTAVRAVASACGANPVAIIIPCHRVRRTDGSLGGYRWGVDVKAALLSAEAHVAVGQP